MINSQQHSFVKKQTRANKQGMILSLVGVGNSAELGTDVTPSPAWPTDSGQLLAGTAWLGSASCFLAIVLGNLNTFFYSYSCIFQAPIEWSPIPGFAEPDCGLCPEQGALPR